MNKDGMKLTEDLIELQRRHALLEKYLREHMVASAIPPDDDMIVSFGPG